MTIARYDPHAPDALDNPYPFYAWLREEAPLYLQPDYGFAVVSRYEDVVSVARNPQDFSSAKGIGPAVVEDTRNMIEMDPPDHTRLRRLVQKAFTPRTIVEARKADPRDDLTTALVQAREERDALSDVEILGSMLLLLVAGNETTTNLIGNGTLAITSDEEQRQLVRTDPSRWPSVVEEILRFDGPI